MATFHDSALGSASASSVGPLATTDALAVTAGDLVVASAKWETGTTTVTFDSGASTPLFTVANAVRQEASGLSICGAVYFWIATATGTINPRFTLGVAKDFREIRAFSITPAAGKTFVLGNVNAADGPSLATAISAGTASATGAGVGVTAIALNGSRTITPGTSWLEPSELNTSISAHAEYQLISGSGTITGDCTLSSAVEWVAQLALFTEVSTGGVAGKPLPRFPNKGPVRQNYGARILGFKQGVVPVTVQTFSYTATGGLTFSGTSAQNRIRVPSISGGIVFAGTSARQYTRVAPVSGGITFAGTSAFAKGQTVTPSGGLVFSGTSPQSRVKVENVSGGVIFGGTASVSFVGTQRFTYTASGGIVFSGSSPRANVRSTAASGGILFGGAASVSYVPPPGGGSTTRMRIRGLFTFLRKK